MLQKMGVDPLPRVVETRIDNDHADFRFTGPVQGLGFRWSRVLPTRSIRV